MANEIIALERKGKTRQAVGYVIPITTPRQVAGANIVLESAGDEHLKQGLSQIQVDAINSGDAIYRVEEMNITDADNAAQVLAAARARFTELKAIVNSEYSTRYQRYGSAFNEV